MLFKSKLEQRIEALEKKLDSLIAENKPIKHYENTGKQTDLHIIHHKKQKRKQSSKAAHIYFYDKIYNNHFKGKQIGDIVDLNKDEIDNFYRSIGGEPPSFAGKHEHPLFQSIRRKTRLETRDKTISVLSVYGNSIRVLVTKVKTRYKRKTKG